MAMGALGLAARRGFADAGSVDGDIMPPPEARMAQAAPAAQSGALGADASGSRWADQMSQGMLGSQMGPGVLSRLDQNQAGISRAVQAKMQRIQDAKNILAQTRGGQTTNLPLMAFGAGMLSPTRTGNIGEALSHGLGQAIPQVQQQRAQDLDYAGTAGKLGIAEADTDLAGQQEASNDFMKRVQMVSQAGTWGDRTAAANQRNEVTNSTRLQIATAGNALKEQLAGTKDETQRAAIIARFFVQNKIADERIQHDIVQEALGQQNANTNERNAGTRERQAGTGETAEKRREIGQIIHDAMAADKDDLGKPRRPYQYYNQQAQAEYARRHPTTGGAAAATPVEAAKPLPTAPLPKKGEGADPSQQNPMDWAP